MCKYLHDKKNNAEKINNILELYIKEFIISNYFSTIKFFIMNIFVHNNAYISQDPWVNWTFMVGYDQRELIYRKETYFWNTFNNKRGKTICRINPLLK